MAVVRPPIPAEPYVEPNLQDSDFYDKAEVEEEEAKAVAERDRLELLRRLELEDKEENDTPPGLLHPDIQMVRTSRDRERKRLIRALKRKPRVERIAELKKDIQIREQRKKYSGILIPVEQVLDESIEQMLIRDGFPCEPNQEKLLGTVYGYDGGKYEAYFIQTSAVHFVKLLHDTWVVESGRHILIKKGNIKYVSLKEWYVAKRNSVKFLLSSDQQEAARLRALIAEDRRKNDTKSAEEMAEDLRVFEKEIDFLMVDLQQLESDCRLVPIPSFIQEKGEGEYKAIREVSVAEQVRREQIRNLSEEARNRALIRQLRVPDSNPGTIEWWPQLAARIVRPRTVAEGDFRCECCGCRGCTEEGAVILRDGLCAMYILGWGSVFGTLEQVERLWPSGEAKNANMYAIVGLCGGIVGLVIGALRMTFFDRYSRVAKIFFLSLIEGAAVFIFTAGEIFTVWCNDESHWGNSTSVYPNQTIWACTVPDLVLARQFAPGPIAAGIVYTAWSTLWNLLSEIRKSNWLSSKNPLVLTFGHLAYGMEYVLKSLLFSRIFQFSMMSINVSKASAYEWAAVPAAIIVAWIQRRKPAVRDRMYTGVLGIMWLIMLAQNIQKTIQLSAEGLSSPAGDTAMGYIAMNIIGLGFGGFFCAIGFRQSVRNYRLIEDTQFLDRSHLSEEIQEFVKKAIEREIRDTTGESYVFSSELLEKIRTWTRQEIQMIDLQALREAGRHDPEKIVFELKEQFVKITCEIIDKSMDFINKPMEEDDCVLRIGDEKKSDGADVAGKYDAEDRASRAISIIPGYLANRSRVRSGTGGAGSIMLTAVASVSVPSITKLDTDAEHRAMPPRWVNAGPGPRDVGMAVPLMFSFPASPVSAPLLTPAYSVATGAGAARAARLDADDRRDNSADVRRTPIASEPIQQTPNIWNLWGCLRR